MSLAEMRRRYQARGLYAATPGTGPAGKTCRDCAHLRHTGNSRKQHPKCGLTNYTRGDATTIRTSTPSCNRFTEGMTDA